MRTITTPREAAVERRRCRTIVPPTSPTKALLIGFALATVAMLVCTAAPARADFFDHDAIPTWVNRLDGPGGDDDSAVDVKLAAGGAAYVAGTVRGSDGGNDFSLVKIVAGSPVWSEMKTYDGSGHGNDYANALALGPGGVVYVVGTSQDSSGDYDIAVVKWSGTTGKRLWVRRYDGPKHLADNSEAIGVDRKGNVTIAGFSTGTNDKDVIVRSWTPSGKVRWTWRYDGPAHGADWANELVVTREGGVYLTGLSRRETASFEALTVRLSSLGKKVWTRRYAGPEGLGAAAYALAPRPGGGVYIAGQASTTASQNDGMIAGYTAAGVRETFTLDSGAGQQMFLDVAVTSTGDVVGVGSTAPAGTQQPRYVRYTPTQGVAASGTVTTWGSDYFAGVATDAFGGYYMTCSNTDVGGDMLVETRRYSTLDGGAVWRSVVAAYSSDWNAPAAIAARGTTVVVVGGADSGGAADTDEFVFTYVY